MAAQEGKRFMSASDRREARGLRGGTGSHARNLGAGEEAKLRKRYIGLSRAASRARDDLARRLGLV